jgi:heme-degrading monooxygenase HmoA
MPIISPDSGHLTVLNVFRADAPEKQDRLLDAMRQIVNAAAYEGWISSTVHSGINEVGTANFIQWRRRSDLERRYASDEFKHQIPLFTELTSSIKLLQTEVASTRRHPAYGGDATEISPDRDDYTVIEILGVAPENLDELVAALGAAQDWLVRTPGFRSHSVLRGKALRGKRAQPLQGSFAVCYSQWDGRQSYDAFRTSPADQQPADRRVTQERLDALVTSVDSNSYRVVHTRSAGQRTPVSA